jgi:acetyltransferase-like isoleucine patch superfamily enzyme
VYLNGAIEVAGSLNSGFLSRSALEALGFKKLGTDVLIHSTAVIVDCSTISLGSRIRIDPYVIISAQGEVEFGDNIHISANTVLAGQGGIRLEDFASVGHNVRILTSTDNYRGMVNPTVPERSRILRTTPIHLGRHSCIATGSILIPGAMLGEGSVVGALSLVGRPLKPWTVYAGVPARRLAERPRNALVGEREYLASLKKSD